MLKKTIIEFVSESKEQNVEIPKFRISYPDLHAKGFPELSRLSSLLSDGETIRLRADNESIKDIASIVAIGVIGMIVLGGATHIAVHCFNDQPHHVTQI